MKNLFIVISLLLIENVTSAQQRWSSAFIGKPESRALYASNVAKAIQSAWENEIASKEKTDLLLDEIIFGQESDKKNNQEIEIAKPITNNIDEIEEVLGIKEKTTDPVKKGSTTQDSRVASNASLEKIKISEAEEPTQKRLNNTGKNTKKGNILAIVDDEVEMDTIYAIPQIPAMFPGGASAMKQFFVKNIETPENVGQAVKGKVFVRFIVDKYGKISRIYLVKGLNDACNHEAMRVVKKMPSWIPAKEGQDNVNSWHTLPIYFEIE
ncbi:TonB family protein [Arcicella aurantiaca]|uniref:TonB family protein n=1 Tax=Arcicella aurantiaca TaxID=591202 RepID=A0A316ED58_9BACT|nr:energy transducer TonB [Arcicella aurantiaca]PWK28509.1 TonB family protein [Arcicella aurantiaca]